MSNQTATVRNYDLEKKDLECILEVSMFSDQIQNAYNAKISQFIQNNKLPGFRPGRVPKNLIQQRYGGAVLQDIAGEFADRSFQEVLKKENITVAAAPRVEITQADLGSDIRYKAVFECLPEVQTPDFGKLKLKNVDVELDDKDQATFFDKKLLEHPEWQDSKKGATDGDRVTIDFTGTIDGVSFEGGQGSDVAFVLGKGQMLPDFESAIVGKKAKSNCKADCTFPDTYHAEELRGKQASFEITVKKVQTAIPGELDDAYLERASIKGKTVEEYKSSQLESLKNESEWAQASIRHSRVMDVLSKTADFLLPKVLVEKELGMLQNEQQNAGKTPQELQDKAEKNIRMTLMIRHLVEHFNLSVDRELVTRYLKMIAPDYIDSNVFVSWYEQDENRMERVKVAVLEQQVVDKVMQEAKAKTENMSFAQAQKSIETEQ